jgi:hypothetical protein
MGPGQTVLDLGEDLLVVAEELLGNPLDAEGVLMAPPDLGGIPDAVRADPAQDLQVRAVGRLPADLEDAKPEADLMRVPGIQQPQRRDEGQLVRRSGRGENEEVFSGRVMAVIGLQEAPDVGAPEAAAQLDVEDRKGEPSLRWTIRWTDEIASRAPWGIFSRSSGRGSMVG